jgi:hypothetical protein
MGRCQLSGGTFTQVLWQWHALFERVDHNAFFQGCREEGSLSVDLAGKAVLSGRNAMQLSWTDMLSLVYSDRHPEDCH